MNPRLAARHAVKREPEKTAKVIKELRGILTEADRRHARRCGFPTSATVERVRRAAVHVDNRKYIGAEGRERPLRKLAAGQIGMPAVGAPDEWDSKLKAALAPLHVIVGDGVPENTRRHAISLSHWLRDAERLRVWQTANSEVRSLAEARTVALVLRGCWQRRARPKPWLVEPLLQVKEERRLTTVYEEGEPYEPPAGQGARMRDPSCGGDCGDKDCPFWEAER